MNKKMERAAKIIFRRENGDELSVINPSRYAERIKIFARTVIFK